MSSSNNNHCPHLTSTVYARAVDFTCPVGYILHGVRPKQRPPAIAVCTAGFRAALPPLLCSVRDDISPADFLAFNGNPRLEEPSRSDTMAFAYSLSIDFYVGFERPDDEGIEWGLEPIIESLQTWPLPYLKSLFLDHLDYDIVELLPDLVRALPKCLERLELLTDLVEMDEPLPSVSLSDLKIMNEALPLLSRLHLFSMYVGCSFARPARYKKPWFANLRELVVDVAEYEHVRETATTDMLFPILKQLRTVSFPRVDQRSVIFPTAPYLSSIERLFQSSHVRYVDMSGLQQSLRELTDMSFEDFNHADDDDDDDDDDDSDDDDDMATLPPPVVGYARGVLDLAALPLSYIGNDFAKRASLEEIYLPPTLEAIASCFCTFGTVRRIDVNLGNIRPGSLEAFGFLEGASSLESVDFLKSLAPGRLADNMVGGAFCSGCKLITRVDIAFIRGVKRISDGFLSGCSALRTVENASALCDVVHIRDQFFFECDSLVFPSEENSDSSFDAPLAEALASLETLANEAFGGAHRVDLRRLPKLREARKSSAELLLSEGCEYLPAKKRSLFYCSDSDAESSSSPSSAASSCEAEEAEEGDEELEEAEEGFEYEEEEEEEDEELEED